MSFRLNEESLFNYLKEKKLNPVIEPQSKQTYLTFKINNMEVLVFCGVRGDGTLLQTIAYLPYQLHELALSDIARLLHVLNREVDIPGFGLDEKQKVLFFRCVIPCLGGMVDPKLIELFLATTKIACETFMEAIGVIASGKTTMDDVMKKDQK